jgi:uncharacterized protein YabN with tetrapyrrole methylase and pyrophosphatase domain
LAIVGLGYRVSSQVTPEALHYVRDADQLFFLAYDAVLEAWLKRIKPDSISLARLLRDLGTWDAVVDKMVKAVKEGRRICAAFSGHPAVCLTPSHMACTRLRRLGYPVRWVPGISAMDCLYADVGIDPGERGCQVFEAKALLDQKRLPDDRIPLIVLQSGLLSRFSEFKKLLRRCYPNDHKITLYEAAGFYACDPVVRRLRLSSLSKRDLGFSSTLFVPPSGAPYWDRDMASRLGIGN